MKTITRARWRRGLAAATLAAALLGVSGCDDPKANDAAGAAARDQAWARDQGDWDTACRLNVQYARDPGACAATVSKQDPTKLYAQPPEVVSVHKTADESKRLVLLNIFYSGQQPKLSKSVAVQGTDEVWRAESPSVLHADPADLPAVYAEAGVPAPE